MKEKKETLYIYARVACITQTQTWEDAVQPQVEAGIRKANELGMNYEIIPAPLVRNEPGKRFGDLVHVCMSGRVKHLFVTELNRITRDSIMMAYFFDLIKEKHIQLYTMNGRLDNPNNAEDLFMFQLKDLLDKRDETIKMIRGNNSSDNGVHS